MKKMLVILLGVACINMIGCGETEANEPEITEEGIEEILTEDILYEEILYEEIIEETYLSEEYLEEFEYNSQKNSYWDNNDNITTWE